MINRRNFIESAGALAVGSAVLKSEEMDSDCVIADISTPRKAYYYAIYILEGPFPQKEAIIAQDAGFSYSYAQCVLKAPFPLGEKAIAQDAGFSYRYAESVLKAPFPLGEKAIAQHPYWSLQYAQDILKAPFPLGEKVIYQDRDDSYRRLYEHFLGQYHNGTLGECDW